ncbi:MAG: guanine deaminase [Gemmatimonadota bacterium]
MTAIRGLVLRGPVLTPLDSHRARFHDDGFVRVSPEGRILETGSWPPDVRSGPVVATGRALVLPAFVDAHAHLPQIDVRGRYGPGLMDWLERFVFPAEARFADPDHAAAVAERFFAALAAAGVGSAAVFATIHHAAADRAVGAAEASGLRVVMGKILMDRNAPAELLEPAETGIAASLALAERWEGAAGGRLHTAITPRFAPTSTRDLLDRAGRAAREAGLRVQTHLSEQPEEIAVVRKLFPDAGDYLEVYERAGLVHDRTILAHAVHCDADAFERIAAADAAIACCPTSNAFLGSGRFPLAPSTAAGVTVAAGSDVGAGPQLSPLDVLRHLAYLDGRPAPAELLFRGTAAGARALGLEGVTGKLEPGLAADLVLLQPPASATGDPLERFAQCVFMGPETRVVATIVEGRIVHGGLPDAPPSATG